MFKLTECIILRHINYLFPFVNMMLYYLGSDKSVADLPAYELKCSPFFLIYCQEKQILNVSVDGRMSLCGFHTRFWRD